MEKKGLVKTLFENKINDETLILRRFHALRLTFV